MVKESVCAIDKETAAKENRSYYQAVFWAAYNVFLEKTRASVPAILPDGNYTEPGGPHDPYWEKWARWRVDFQLCGQHALHGIEERIFTLHLCMGLSRDRTRRMVCMPSVSSFQKREQLIAEKVGKALVDSGIWPLFDICRTGYFDPEK